MVILLTEKITPEQLKIVAKDLDGYIKFVVDILKEILAAGGEMHADSEKLLLENGSEQRDLWGGGLDLETGEVDYNSMINIRPDQNNASRDVLDIDIRKKIDIILHKLLI